MKKATNYFANAKVFAKINLALNVCGICDNGYHNLQSILVNVPLYDTIKTAVRNDKVVHVKYSTGVEYSNDVAVKVANYLIKKFELPGVDISIEKHIPESAGLGGSSADAAGVLLTFKQLFDLDLDLYETACLGSDIPYMMRGGPQLLSGIGDKLFPVELNNYYGILLVNKQLKLSTRSVFECYDKLGGTHWDYEAYRAGVRVFSNSLELAAIVLCPEISDLRKHLENENFEHVVMTGSGSGMIGFSSSEKLQKSAFSSLKRIYDNKENMMIVAFNTVRKK
ncbi:MAG: hypothetical protein LBF12_00700 [Christensenellaceae bacterium]|jgi:4-diphosphocytidyl-2-C-methyl-D-erythritol kinase|nr:hypothetical protein [Christensenellaceae bacterium]